MLFQQAIFGLNDNQYLLNWITDCGHNIKTMIISFNIFCEIHYENMPYPEILKNLQIVINTLKNNIDKVDKPLTRIEELKPNNYNGLWDSRESYMNEIDSLSSIITVKKIIDFYNDKRGKPPDSKEDFNDYSDQITKEYVEYFKYHVDNNSCDEKFSGNDNIAWFMPSSDLYPFKNRYLIFSCDKSRFLHSSTASTSTLLELLTSVADSLLPTNFLDIIERVRVLTPVKYIMHKSCRIDSSYCLLLGIISLLNSPLLSLGTLTSTSPIPFIVKCRSYEPFR